MMNSEQLASHITVGPRGLPRERVRGKKRPKPLKDTAVGKVFPFSETLFLFLTPFSAVGNGVRNPLGINSNH